MSAFLVSETHLNVIVSYFVGLGRDDGLWFGLKGEYAYLTRENAPDVAQALYDENIRSVNHRYNEQSSDYLFSFTYIRDAKYIYKVGEIAKALDCLEYQSCETDDYHNTDAWAIVCAMRKHLLSQVATKQGVDIWEINEVKANVLAGLV